MIEETGQPAMLDPQGKRALLKRLLGERAGRSEATFPLSLGQQALWFFYRFAPQSAAYNVAFWGRVQSAVDCKRLQSALQALVGRHPMLRVAFDATEHGQQQRICPATGNYLQVVDARGWDDETLNGRVAEMYRLPFDLEDGEVFRAVLFSRNDSDHTFLLAVHHIVFDAWSLGIVLRDLASLYDMSSELGCAGPHPPQRTYVDFVRWQAELLDSPRGHSLWEYWRQRLSGAPHVLNLITDRPRPAVQTYHAASHRFRISDTLSSGIRMLARTEGSTSFMLLAAAFQVLLFRYTGQSDVLIGIPLHGRPSPEFDHVVGYFVNPVILRSHVADGTHFRQQLAETRESVLTALEHGEYPFVELVRRIQPKRDASRGPLVQAVFNFVRADQVGVPGEVAVGEGAGSRIRLGALEFDGVTLDQPGGQFDIELDILDERPSLAATLTYNSDLFNHDTIAQMAGDIETLLVDVVADPDRRVGELLPDADASRRRRHSARQSGQETGANVTVRPPALGRTVERHESTEREEFEL